MQNPLHRAFYPIAIFFVLSSSRLTAQTGGNVPLVQPAVLSAFTVPSTTFGGSTVVTGKILLSKPVPSRIAVHITSSRADIVAPPEIVYVPVGASSVSFTMKTNIVSVATNVTLSAQYGVKLSSSLVVKPVQLSNLVLPTTAVGGASISGTVHLNGILLADASVTLYSSSPAVLAVPSSVTVLRGQTSATFFVTSAAVNTAVPVTLTARWNGSARNTTLSITAPPPSTPLVTVKPGDDLQAASDANPPGTKFLIKAGVHRMQRVRPKDNQEFTGEPGAILTGARQLTNFIRAGNLWYTAGQNQQEQQNGHCLPTAPRCTFSEDLFLDDVPLKHASSLADVVSGSWFFDYDADRIYLADDPTNRKVETSVTRGAFWGLAKGVTIRGLIVEKYAIPAQMGAIGDQYPGEKWVIEGNEVRWNHGTGITGGTGAQILRNLVHHNGQKGIGANGDDVLVDGNEISFNNYAAFSPEWEAGGTKFALTKRLTVRNNFVHHNAGSGLWTDIDNINTLYENNRVEHNTHGGISHEISYSATIRSNIVKNNGWAFAAWLWGGQIQVQNSQNVEVHNNVVSVGANGGNGIVLVQQNRGDGLYGPYLTVNNWVHHNDITYLGKVGMTGAAADWKNSLVFDTNRFASNTYHAVSMTLPLWAWGDAARDWNGFRAQGQDVSGLADTNVK